MKGGFDIVLSHNSMEHFGDPARILDVMKSALKPDGRLYITFGPPWYAPYGSHMHFFTRVPWVNLLFSERTVMAVRARYRNDADRKGRAWLPVLLRLDDDRPAIRQKRRRSITSRTPLPSTLVMTSPRCTPA